MGRGKPRTGLLEYINARNERGSPLVCLTKGKEKLREDLGKQTESACEASITWGREGERVSERLRVREIVLQRPPLSKSMALPPIGDKAGENSGGGGGGVQPRGKEGEKGPVVEVNTGCDGVRTRRFG
jgi:hypothetical protein